MAKVISEGAFAVLNNYIGNSQPRIGQPFPADLRQRPGPALKARTLAMVFGAAVARLTKTPCRPAIKAGPEPTGEGPLVLALNAMGGGG